MPQDTDSINAIEMTTSDQDLVSNKTSSPKKAMTVLILIAIVVLGSMMFIMAYERMQTLPVPEPRNGHTRISLDNILDGTYEPHRFNGSWVSESQILMKNEFGHAVIYDVAERTSRLLAPLNILEPASTMELSADGKYLLVSSGIRKLFRHSNLAEFFIIDIEKKTRVPITNQKGEIIPLQLVLWAPFGNSFAYVFQNDVYYRFAANSTKEVRLTTDGLNTVIYNGVCDWVYEEEVFGATSAMWFSVNGSKLAFASFNDSLVDVMTIPYYGEPGSLAFQYPRLLNVRYPKPNRTNPMVSLNVVDLVDLDGVNNKPTLVSVPPPSDFREPILSAVTWISDSELCPTWMNRVQNKAKILACDANNGTCLVVKALEKDDGWLDLFKPPAISSDGNQFLFIYSHSQGKNVGDFSHVTLMDRKNDLLIPLTKGLYTVTEIVIWDEKRNLVYYTATNEGTPEVQHLYRIRASNEVDAINREPECISCNIDRRCHYSDAKFSKQGSYFVFICYGPDIPEMSVYSAEKLEKVLLWEGNQRLKGLLKNTTLPQTEYLNVPVGEGMNARVKLYFPPGVNRKGNVKYPLLVNVYGGPGSTIVNAKYGVPWNSYFCVNGDVVIAYIDGRGSGLKGDRMLYAGYRRLGTVEIEDQIAVTKYLVNKYTFIDSRRTGIWGWSYGGYVAGMVLAKDTNNIFKCGISVAPVTDWIYYDTIYTERYMGLPTPEDNLNGYVNSSLIKWSRNLHKSAYLIVHGTFDDNVHYQQSMMLIRTLELEDIPFSQQTYPDEEHGLGGVRHHLYHTLQSFLVRCFER